MLTRSQPGLEWFGASVRGRSHIPQSRANEDAWMGMSGAFGTAIVISVAAARSRNVLIMQFYTRLIVQTRKEMPTRLLLGQWQIHTETETATVNAVPISPQSRLYIFPDTGKRCSIRVLDESREEQSFPDWQIPSDLLLESLGFFAGTLDKLDKLSGNLWEKWVNTSPLVHDIGKTIRPQRL